MAPKVSGIDLEWASSLEGLRVKVPNRWWYGYTDGRLNDGRIGEFHASTELWDLILDDSSWGIFGINYEALYQYADESASTYEDYRCSLLMNVVGAVDEEIIVVDTGGTEKKYVRTDTEDWKKINVEDGDTGRKIDPIPWEEDQEDFSVKLTDEELQSMKNEDGEIRFEHVLRWTLPTFEGEDDSAIGLFEWQAARMRNYMTKLMMEDSFLPRYYDPVNGKLITGDHVARFYGVMLGKMFSGGKSVDQMYDTREWFNAVAPVQASMPVSALKDMMRCLHYVDDWDDDDWDEVYDDIKQESGDNTAKHRKKFSMVEDAYNRRWQSMVNFGKWLTADESRAAGWYNSVMTMGPEPKPVRTGATLHSLCVTKGPLSTYKLFVRTYGGRSDTDLNKKHPNTATLLKWISLYSIMLDSFKGKGHCLTMDSAYCGDAMCLIGRHEWKINMVGTAQSNRTGGGPMAVKEMKQVMKKGSYDSLFYQHDVEDLTFSVWADNNFVKVLSNFHSPRVAVGGLKRKRRGVDGRREREPSEVDCPEQMKAYSETFHQIDKGNGVESTYDLGGKSRKHGWGPKLALRLFNMNLNNAYQIYCELYKKEHPGCIPLSIRAALQDATHFLLQQGETMRQRDADEAPSPTKDLSSHVNNLPGSGRKQRNDKKGMFSQTETTRVHPGAPVASAPTRSLKYRRRRKLAALLRKQPWRSHQSIAGAVAACAGRCVYNKCPALQIPIKERNSIRYRGAKTRYMCEECSIMHGEPVWLCNRTVKTGDKSWRQELCHIKHHCVTTKVSNTSDTSDASSSEDG